MSSLRRLGRWLLMASVLSSGAVFQISCSQAAVDVATNISDAFVRNFISEWLGLSSGLGGLTGLGT